MPLRLSRPAGARGPRWRTDRGVALGLGVMLAVGYLGANGLQAHRALLTGAEQIGQSWGWRGD